MNEQQPVSPTPERRHRGGVVGGAILITIGVMALLSQIPGLNAGLFFLPALGAIFLVAGVLSRQIGLLIPGGAWRELKWVLSTRPDGTPANAITYGAFLGSLVDFVIVAFVVFMVTKALLKPAPAAPGPVMKECPECKESIPAAARKCRACASAV